MKKVELLAPAGNLTCFYAAMAAGADAVYLAMQKYGARAFSDNFSEEDLLTALHYANARGKKIYITCNTLVKQAELEELVQSLKPYYEAGLCGVIVQDLGVVAALRQAYPDLEIHASTQMSIASAAGARALKDMGLTRVVPAREVSLAELKEMKEVGVEIEVFIHGAMCYCYSGQCLMSSLLGGRSGNRGRCAQPCRLPYRYLGKNPKGNASEQYVLSLKDMNMLSDLPMLLEAGMDSFKIEGRMKSPEYVYGVTSLYRKYIDLLESGKMTKDSFRIDQADLNRISHLYIRSETSNGYYFRHNGKEMVTLSSPAYSGQDDQMIARIQQEMADALKAQELPLHLLFTAHVGAPISLKGNLGNHTYEALGAIAEKAQKQGADPEQVRSKIDAFGNTGFTVKEFDIQMDSDVFLPASMLKSLRRDLIAHIEEKNRPIRRDAEKFQSIVQKNPQIVEDKLFVRIHTEEQYQALQKLTLDRTTYMIDLDVWMQNPAFLPTDLFFLALPRMIRQENTTRLIDLLGKAATELCLGFLVPTMDGLGLLRACGLESRQLIFDSSFYVWNQSAFTFVSQMGTISVPVELHSKDVRELLKGMDASSVQGIIYGRTPLMLTANCVKKTCESCNHTPELVYLKDRKDVIYPVESNCHLCMNTIWNSLPTNLYEEVWKWKEDGIGQYRVELSIESGQEATDLVKAFHDLIYLHHCKGSKPDFMKQKTYTTGHMNRGAE